MKIQCISMPPQTIEPIADNGDPQAQSMGGMKAQLVGSAGQRCKLDQAAAGNNPPVAPQSNPQFTVDRIIDLARPIVRVQTKTKPNFPLFSGHQSIHQGKVAFFDAALGKLDGQMAMGLPGQTKDHQPGGIHVKTVDSGLVDAFGDKVTYPGGNTVLLVRTATGNRQQSPWLIDHHQLSILVQEGEFLFNHRPQS